MFFINNFLINFTNSYCLMIFIDVWREWIIVWASTLC